MSPIDEMLERINANNLRRIQESCETDGDHKLADLIRGKLASGTSSEFEDARTLRS